jgi:hypothetical protein
MKREEIEKAATEFADREYEISDIDRDALHKGFFHGAEWRINSSWHEISELPKMGEHILVHFKSGSLASFFVSSDIMEVFNKFNVICWAYVLDLLPERK